jgi:hypothetical protein
MSFVDFRELSPPLQAEAYLMRPKWPLDELERFAFWVKPDGHLSRRAGHHQLAKAEGKKIDAMLRAEPVRSKGDLAHYKTARFSLAPERR